MKLEHIPIENLYVSELNVRKNMTSEEDETNIEELAENIKNNGLINPLTVKLNDNKYEIIAGQRRFLACKLINLNNIPCNIINVSNEKAEELSLIENVQRNQMTYTDKIHSYTRLYNLYNKDIKKVCNSINISEKTIRKYIKLDNLPNEILQFLDVKGENKLTLETAVKLTQLDNKNINLIDVVDSLKTMNPTQQNQCLTQFINEKSTDLNYLEDIKQNIILNDNKINLAPSFPYIFYNKNFYEIPDEMNEEIFNLLQSKYDIENLLV